MILHWGGLKEKSLRSLRSLTCFLFFALACARRTLAKKQKARVLLVGIRLPPNYGGNYTQKFEAVYRNLAKHQKISLLPFLLEPIAQDAQSFQADGLHPTAEAQPRILNHVWPSLAPLLKSSRQ